MREPLVPMNAYQVDVGEGTRWLGHPTQPHGWFSITHLAYRIASLPPEARLAFIRTTPESLLPDPALRPTHVDYGNPRSVNPFVVLSEQLRVAAEEMERDGCFEMAYTTVTAAARIVARFDAASAMCANNQLARIARQLGEVETAEEIYRNVVEDGTTRGFPAVAGLALAGLGNIAIMRGNRPAQLSFFSRALAVAPDGSSLESAARWGLMNYALATNSLADALLHGWRAHDLATTDDERAGILSNLASVAHQARFVDQAVAGFEGALRLAKPARLWLSIAASAAQAAGDGGRPDLLKQLEQRGQRHASTAVPFEHCQWLLGLAQGWNSASEVEPAERFAREALALARTHEFHELAYRAEEALDRITTQPLVTASLEIGSPAEESLPEAARTGLARLCSVAA